MIVDKISCTCPICGDSHIAHDKRVLRSLHERIDAQKRFGKYIVIHRSHVKGLDDIVFFHCKSVRSAKYQLSRRIKEFRTDPNDWSQHLDFAFVAEPVAVLYQKMQEPSQIDLSTIVGKITFCKWRVEDLYWKADYHGLDCYSRSCSCSESTHQKLYKKTRNNARKIQMLLSELVYDMTKVPSDKESTIWDRFHAINKMLDELFVISEHHGLLGVQPVCGCAPEIHAKMKIRVEEALDAIIKILE